MDVLAGQLSSNGSSAAAGEEDAPIEWLEYDFVKKCTNKSELQRILKTLQSGKHGKYEHLETTVEEKLMSLMTPQERSIYIAMNHEPSWRDQVDARSDLHTWIAQAQGKSKADLGRAPHKLPPARGQAKESESPQPAQASAVQATVAAKASSGTGTGTSAELKRDSKAEPFSQYYDRWAKVDVDAEIAKMESDEAKKAALAEDAAWVAQAQAQEKRAAELKKLKLIAADIDQLPAAQRAMLAEKEKVKGNESFKAGEFDESIYHYSRALAYEGTKSQAAAVLFTNRAQARLKNKSFAAAEEDGDAALAIDPSSAKAWTRRGTARLRRGNAQGAVSDLKQALQLLAGNEAGSAEVRRLLVEAQGKVEPGQASGSESTGSSNTRGNNVIEEIIDPFAKKAGSKKIVIEDGDVPAAVSRPAGPAAPSAGGSASSGGTTAAGSGKGKARRVVIEEDEEDAAHPPTVAAPSPAPASSTAAASASHVPVAGKKKIIIEEDATQAPVATQATAPVVNHQPAPSASSSSLPSSQSHNGESSAESLKRQGNDLVGQGKYAEAVDCYSRSLAMQPRNPAVLANRAQARLNLQQYSSACLDCTMALEACHVTSDMVSALAARTHKSTSDAAAATAIDAVRVAAGSDLPLSLKALYRRSKAYRAQGRLMDALTDLAAGLALEPNNASVGKDYAEVKALVKTIPVPATASVPVASAAAASVTRVAPPPVPATSTSTSTPSKVALPGTQATSPVPAASASASSPATAVTGSNTPAAAPASPASPAPSSSSASKQKAAVAVAAAAIAKASTSSPSLAGKVYPIPKTVLELENALIGLRRNPAGLAQYIRCLNGSVLKSIGQRRAIEPDSIESILHTMELMCDQPGLQTAEDAAWATDVLEGLTGTHGWETACAMLGASELSAIAAIVSAARRVGSVEASRLDAIEKACQQ